MATACRFGCCSPEVDALPRGGWSEDGLTIDPRRQEHVRREWAATSARIDKVQGDYPKCPCGQRALALDKFGLCAKVDVRHQERRGVYSAPKKKARTR